jgi:hypothetical protein
MPGLFCAAGVVQLCGHGAADANRNKETRFRIESGLILTDHFSLITDY